MALFWTAVSSIHVSIGRLSSFLVSVGRIFPPLLFYIPYRVFLHFLIPRRRIFSDSIKFSLLPQLFLPDLSVSASFIFSAYQCPSFPSSSMQFRPFWLQYPPWICSNCCCCWVVFLFFSSPLSLPLSLSIFLRIAAFASARILSSACRPAVFQSSL